MMIYAALPQKASQKKVLLAASECVPFVKTGGLADVLGALPIQLKEYGVDARVILPLYGQIKRKYAHELRHVCHFVVNLGWRTQFCGIETLTHRGVTFYFVDNEFYFDRGYIYGDFTSDEGERFAFFCRAVLDALPHIGFLPDVLHVNDWQAGMIPALLRLQYHSEEYNKIKTLITIHNLRFQGKFDDAFMDEALSLGDEVKNVYTMAEKDCINFLKAGISYADRVNTVSPRYAEEILTEYFGENLQETLRSRQNVLSGILNGIDTHIFNPNTDENIEYHFTAAKLSGKEQCKLALLNELGLQPKKDVPLLAIVSRLTDQKGLDLIDRVICEIMDQDVQLVVLGSGDVRYEQLFTWAQWRYSGRVAARFGYDEALARRIYAGADIFLMPSGFEPCGLSQLIAMRYGTIPVVRETGGLADSVAPYNKFTDTGVGFSFLNYNAHELLYTVQHAVAYYHDKPMWNRLVKRAMAEDNSWANAAKAYLALYNEM